MFNYKANNKIKWLAMVISNSCCVAMRHSSNGSRNCLKIDTFWNLIRERLASNSLLKKSSWRSRRQIASSRISSHLKCQTHFYIYFLFFCGTESTISNASGAKSHSTIKWFARERFQFSLPRQVLHLFETKRCFLLILKLKKSFKFNF